MPNKTRFAASLLAATLIAGACFAQAENPRPPEGPKAYQLDFVVKEVEEGKVVNSRNYSMLISAASGGGSIRSGDRVSVMTKGGTQPEYSYVDVGVNIDCRNVQETQGKLTLVVTADVSSAASDATRPLIRTARWSANVVVPLRKSTALFSSDDTSSKRRMTLDLTATPVN